jgi:hypothetical protein
MTTEAGIALRSPVFRVLRFAENTCFFCENKYGFPAIYCTVLKPDKILQLAWE